MSDERQSAGDEFRRYRVRVDPGDGWFDGHFPGRPVLPAVALLNLLHRGWIESDGGVRPIAGFEQWRFLEPVRPGETVEFAIGRPDARGARVVVRRDGKTVASGLVRLAVT